MRISRWPVLVCGWMLAAVVGQTAFAFQSADEYEFSAEDGAEFAADATDDYSAPQSLVPVQYMEPGAGMPPPDGAANPYSMQGGYPPSAWPEVSPFYGRQNMDQIVNQDGLWQRSLNFERVKGIFSMEFLIAWGLRPGDRRVGDPQFQNLTFANGYSDISATETPDFPSFITNFSNIKHYGGKARLGWENPDESGVIFSGFYLFENEQQIGPGQIFFGNDVRELRPLASIAYGGNGGAIDANLALFDAAFALKYDQEIWGADADIYAAPFFRRGNFKLAFTYGAKYLQVFETFSVTGTQTNFGYTVSAGDIIDGTITDFGIPFTSTVIDSSVRSNIVGPQVGLRYDLGGDKFKIWGQTKIAVAANIQESELSGVNAISTLAVFPGGGGGLIIGGGPNIPFSHSNNTTHISPILDQSIYGEFPLFAMLPGLNRITCINRAKFRIGYNFVLINNVARPAQQFLYVEQNPILRTDPTWFSFQTVSFAADWRF